MATPQTVLDQEVVHDHALVTDLPAVLQTMDNKVRVEARFYELVDRLSHSERSYHNDG
jgi:hypothetical protein